MPSEKADEEQGAAGKPITGAAAVAAVAGNEASRATRDDDPAIALWLLRLALVTSSLLPDTTGLLVALTS